MSRPPVRHCRVKFCGIMSPADARAAADTGADAVGMILHANARRRIDTATAAAIVSALPPYVTPVGLFVDAPTFAVKELAQAIGLTTVQFHGNETPAQVAAVAPLRVTKVIGVDDNVEHKLHQWRQAVGSGQVPNLIGIQLDHAGGGGSGIVNNFERIHELQRNGLLDELPPLIVAGGLTPDNVGGVVRQLRPYAVDTSSGIEAEYGQKSVDRMRAFIEACRDAMAS